jgi:hypothetical protein
MKEICAVLLCECRAGVSSSRDVSAGSVDSMGFIARQTSCCDAASVGLPFVWHADCYERFISESFERKPGN